ncbi:MAG: GNAT family N-acetyltransferase [Parcubacteria group bacterium]
MDSIIIRKAKRSDAKDISDFTRINKDTMIFRSPEKIRSIIGNYFIALSKEGKIAGCCGFKIYPGGDAEIISLAVAFTLRGKGIGRKLINSCLKEALRRKSVLQVMAFTNPKSVNLFKKSGFTEAGVQLFHEKILEDCKKCPRNIMKKGRYQCNETALVYIGKNIN